jgi:hypothetical protein
MNLKEIFQFYVNSEVTVMVFNATLTLFRLYRGGQFNWWRKPEYQEKTTDGGGAHPARAPLKLVKI